MIAEEIARIEKVTDEALELVHQRDFNGAKRLLRTIENSHCCSEADHGCLLVRGMILVLKRKFPLVKELLMRNNFVVWGSPDLLYMLRLCRPKVSRETKKFTLTLRGGCARFGMFTQFTEDHEVELEVLADSSEKALAYSKALCQFESSDSVVVVSCEESMEFEKDDYKGVLRTSPFRLKRSEGITTKMTQPQVNAAENVH